MFRDAGGKMERDVRLYWHDVEDDLAGQAGHIARRFGAHREEGRLTGQNLE